jgi:hypothetical protein
VTVTDCHIHVMPWWEMKPAAFEVMTRGRTDLDELHQIMKSPTHLLRRLDADGIDRAVLEARMLEDQLSRPPQLGGGEAVSVGGGRGTASPHFLSAPTLKRALSRRHDIEGEGVVVAPRDRIRAREIIETTDSHRPGEGHEVDVNGCPAAGATP